jgi:hypothetical protein
MPERTFDAPFTFQIQISHQTSGISSESLPAQPGIQQGASRRSVGTWSGTGLPDPGQARPTMAIRIMFGVRY